MKVRREAYEEEKKKLMEEKYHPNRELLRPFVQSILSKYAKLPKEKIEAYTSNENMKLFEIAFTHSSYNPECNYEAFEIVGDAILNSCVVIYLMERFPELMELSGKGVSTFARLKINLVSKEVFSKCADSLGFAEHIASDMLTRNTEMQSLLEDTFEAFQCALLKVMRKEDTPGANKLHFTGFGPTFRIISILLNEINISLKYEDLYDVKSRLKHLVEKWHQGTVQIYTDDHLDDNRKIVFTSKVKLSSSGPKVWGTASAFKKSQAEQTACEDAIRNLNLAGFN
jgi:dsRNA-specific ribonuclease